LVDLGHRFIDEPRSGPEFPKRKFWNGGKFSKTEIRPRPTRYRTLRAPDTHSVHTTYALAATTTGALSSKTSTNLKRHPGATEDGRKIAGRSVRDRPQAGVSRLFAARIATAGRDRRHSVACKTAVPRRARHSRPDAPSEIRPVPIKGMPGEDAPPRSPKAINFGLIYGHSEFGLANQLGIAARKFAYIKNIYERFPGIAPIWMRTRRFLPHPCY